MHTVNSALLFGALLALQAQGLEIEEGCFNHHDAIEHEMVCIVPAEDRSALDYTVKA